MTPDERACVLRDLAEFAEANDLVGAVREKLGLRPLLYLGPKEPAVEDDESWAVTHDWGPTTPRPGWARHDNMPDPVPTREWAEAHARETKRMFEEDAAREAPRVLDRLRREFGEGVFYEVHVDPDSFVVLDEFDQDGVTVKAKCEFRLVRR